MNKDEVKDYIAHALQSSRGLTSDLASDIIKKMGEKIDTSIDKSVNGKIIKLTEMMQNHIEHDKEWKEKYSPYLEGLSSIAIGGKIMGKVIIFIGAVGGAIIAIKKWFL